MERFTNRYFVIKTLSINSPPSSWPWNAPEDPIGITSTDAETLPRLTIVTPSYNQAAFLEATLRSVLLQNYPNLEYIVIDGGSTDGSVEIIRRYQDRIAYWVSEPDNGQCHAINKGFSKSTGEWMAWLNSDDIYLPGTLWTIARTILSHKDCNWVVGAVEFADRDLKPFSIFKPVCRTDVWVDFVCTKRKNGTALPQAGSFWSRKSWDLAGPLDESLHYAMDHEYWGRLAYHGFRPLCIQQSLALFRLHTQGKTARGDSDFMAEERIVIQKWLGKVTDSDSKILINYQRSFGLRLLLRNMKHRMNCFLDLLRGVVHRYRNAKIHNAD